MNLQHHFLIAMPTLQDPRFKRSVIYVCEHNEEGAMGLVINKPVEQFTVATVLSKLKIMPPARDPAISLDKPVFAGGPWRTIAGLSCIRRATASAPAFKFRPTP